MTQTIFGAVKAGEDPALRCSVGNTSYTFRLVDHDPLLVAVDVDERKGLFIIQLEGLEPVFKTFLDQFGCVVVFSLCVANKASTSDVVSQILEQNRHLITDRKSTRLNSSH